MLKVKWQCR